MRLIDEQVAELTRLLELRLGPLTGLYDRVFDGCRVCGVDEIEDDD